MALWVVATPIGTLADLSPRARQILSSVSLIASEDTRVTRKLLSAMDIPAPELLALHAHNEVAVAARVVDAASESEVALVCDAGTPAISDPGVQIVAEALRAGVKVRTVPGPSSLTAAISVAGFSASPFTFLGFAPRKGRDTFCAEALGSASTLVVFEAPTRVADLFRRLAAQVPDREAALCRELSKRYEEVCRGPLQELATTLAERDLIKGECVVVIGPGEVVQPVERNASAGSMKSIAAVLADRWGIKRKEAYNALLRLEQELESGAD